MKKVRWVSAAAGMALVAATFALPAAGVAYAAGNPGNGNTVGNGNLGVGSGNTITAPVSLPINLCGISVAILGGASSSCVGGASSNTNVGGSGTGGSGGAGGNGNVVGNRNLGVVSGNTVTAPISAPVNLCGVSGAAGGFANSGCTGGSHTNTTIGSGGSGSGGGAGNGNVIGNGNASVLSGNTITAPISAPVNLCGVSLALLGFSNSGCVGGASTDVTVLPGSGNGNTVGSGNLGVGSGNTITAPVSLPVNVCGVSLAVLGFSNSECQGGASTCTDSQCTPPGCTGDQCPPPCHKDHCPPPCHKDQCPPPCHKDQCPPPCHSDHCPPPCQGDHCTPPGCTTHCTPPTCQGNCTPPGNNTPPPGSTPPGSTTTVTTSTLPSGSLPTTGANLLALLVGGLGALAVGAGTIVLARRRRSGEAS